MAKRAAPYPTSSSYESFKLARHGVWSFPEMHEVHALMRHPKGVILLACFLLLNYCLASLVVSVPVAAQDPLIAEDWLQDAPMRARLDRQYRAEAPQLMAAYLTRRGAFAAQIAAGERSADAAASWQATARGTKEQLLAMKVPGPLKEVHLGLVVAIGLDEVAADQLRRAYAPGGNPVGAEASFAAAEERLTVVLQSAPWLIP